MIAPPPIHDAICSRNCPHWGGLWKSGAADGSVTSIRPWQPGQPFPRGTFLLDGDDVALAERIEARCRVLWEALHARRRYAAGLPASDPWLADLQIASVRNANELRDLLHARRLIRRQLAASPGGFR